MSYRSFSNFNSIADNCENEKNARDSITSHVLKFGIEFLDRSLRGIFRDDLILIGAPSGVGKTQFCVNVALHNMRAGKNIHMIALEASEYEIERRLKYAIIADLFFQKRLNTLHPDQLNYVDWLIGKLDFILSPLEDEANVKLKKYKNFFTMYKTDKFGLTDLVDAVTDIASDTDLVIIDHVHYFDIEGDNENKGLKEIIMMIRKLTQVTQKPIMLVSHLRKRDRKYSDLVASIDDFHGSSDLVKVATKIISIAPGNKVSPDNHRFETYFRIPKNRTDGSCTRYIGKQVFNYATGTYEREIALGKLSMNGSEFVPITPEETPTWLR